MARPASFGLVVASNAVVVAVAVFSAAATVEAQPSARPRGFDHLIHDRTVVGAGGESLACASCHRVDGRGALVGRPDHAACFGACHGSVPDRPPVSDGSAAICATCHPPTSLAAWGGGRRAAMRPPWPPYTIERDWGIRLSHRAHVSRTGCEACHPTIARPGKSPTSRPHQRCGGCHTAPGAPPMTDCTTCHVAAYGPVTGPSLAPSPFRVGTAFSHAAHRPRGATCRGCHTGVVAATDAALPAPSHASCADAGCHDTGQAFATTEACSRCHRQAPDETFRPVRPAARFSHRAHTERGAAACATCHTVDGRGDAVASGHRACASCHAADFASRTPTICGACHLSTEPWRHLVADQRPPRDTEWGSRFSHVRHPGTCETCHQVASGHRQRRPPRGHLACASAGCHAAAQGPTPRLGDCAACHQLGLASARDQERRDAPWSVRARFHHDDHAGAACTTCHQGVPESTSVVPTPKKAACASCHDGVRAFSMTGHGCARCHGNVTRK